MTDEIRIELDGPRLAALPSGWADERDDDTLWAFVERTLAEVGYDPKTVKKRRNDWARLREALEPADVTTVEDWLDPEGRRRAFDALTEAARRGDLGGTADTLDTRLQSLKWGLTMAGLPKGVLLHVGNASKQVCRSSGIVKHEQPEYGPEEVRALLAVLDDWQSRPLMQNAAHHTVHEGVTLDRGDGVKPWRLAQLRAFVLTSIGFNLRFNEVRSLLRRDVDEDEARWVVVKQRRYGEPARAERVPVAVA